MYRIGHYLKEGGYYSVPCLLVEAPHLRDITARLVAVMLYYVAHRVSSPHFFAKDSTLAAAFQVDPKTFRKAIANLIRCRLLRSIPATRGGKLSEYWLCHSVSGEPLPEEAGRATPTFNGFRKAARAADQKVPRDSATSPARPVDVQGLAKKRFPESTSNGTKLISPEPYQATRSDPDRTNPPCHIAVHDQVHYREDDSRVCGDCHPTGRTQPPSTNKASTPLISPPAKDIGFEVDDDPGDVPF